MIFPLEDRVLNNKYVKHSNEIEWQYLPQVQRYSSLEKGFIPTCFYLKTQLVSSQNINDSKAH